VLYDLKVIIISVDMPVTVEIICDNEVASACLVGVVKPADSETAFSFIAIATAKL